MPVKRSQAFIKPDAGINNESEALEGAKHILIELFSETAPLLEALRQSNRSAQVEVRLAKGKEAQAAKFQDYFDYREAWKKFPATAHWPYFVAKKNNYYRSRLIIPRNPPPTLA